MRRRFPTVSRRTFLLGAALLLWVVLRIGQDHLAYQRRETTVASLTEGPYRVGRVLHGDTLLVQPIDHPSASSVNSEARARVRLLGISLPGRNAAQKVFDGDGDDEDEDRQPSRPWQQTATTFTRDFVAQGVVRLRLDRRRIDRNGVFLAYVFVGSRMLNEELVRAGLARVDVQPCDSSTVVRRLRTAEADARRRRTGIWLPPPSR